MSACEGALGPICWILTDGLRRIGGRLATALFGNGAELLTDGARPLALVPGIATGGGTAFAADAIELATAPLELTNPRRPRFLYLLSDGGWPTPAPASPPSTRSPSTPCRRSTSASAARRCRSTATASPSSPT